MIHYQLTRNTPKNLVHLMMNRIKQINMVQLWFRCIILFLISHIVFNTETEVVIGNATQQQPVLMSAVPNISTPAFVKKLFSKDKSTSAQQESSKASWARMTNAPELKLTDAKVKQSIEAGRKLVGRFAHVAKEEQAKYNIPASITLATCILLSDAGKAPILEASNNYFLLPCGTSMTCMNIANGQQIASFDTAWESFRQQSIFLSKDLQKRKIKNTKDWCQAVGNLYPQIPHMDRQLLTIMDALQLTSLD